MMPGPRTHTPGSPRPSLDLRAADLELGVSLAGLWGDVAFHAQQAAEKALKAVLAWHGNVT